MKKQCRYILILVLMVLCLSGNYLSGQTEEKPEEKNEPVAPPKTSLKLNLDVKDGIFRNKSPIMLDINFTNESNKPEKICTYKLYESLIKIDIRDCKNKSIDFSPKLLKAGKITKNDWVTILPGRVFKTSFSLTRKMIEATGYRMAPGNYKMKVIYEGCFKFDPSLPEEKLESNWLYLIITD